MSCIRALLSAFVAMSMGLQMAFGDTEFKIDTNADQLSYQIVMDDEQCRPLSDVELRGGGIVDQFYLSPKKIILEEGRLSFSPGRIENVRLILEYGPHDGKCERRKKMIINGRLFELIAVTVEFESFFKLRSIASIVFEVRDQVGEIQEQKLERHELEGFLSLYQLSLGGAFNIGTSFRPRDHYRFRSGDPTVEPIPAFLVRYGPFFVNNDGAGFLFLPFDKLVGLMTFLIEGEPVESEGFLKRRRSIFLGPLFVIGPLELHYYKEARGIHHGEVLKATYDYKLKLTKQFSLQLRPFVQYWDSSYVNYYFGSTRAEKSFYQTQSTYNYGAGAQLNYQDRQWSYFASFTVKRFGPEVRESPMTTRGTDYRLILGGLVHLF